MSERASDCYSCNQTDCCGVAPWCPIALACSADISTVFSTSFSTRAEQVCQLAAGSTAFEPISHLSGFLRFQADLRLPSSVHGTARQAHVQHLIHQLGLQKVSHHHAIILSCFQRIVEDAGDAHVGVAMIMPDCSFCRKCMHCMQCEKGGPRPPPPSAMPNAYSALWQMDFTTA